MCMNKKGWLINDCLTCIPNTRTFWHDLLEWFPNLEDKCNGYTDYSVLASRIESTPDRPDYIIRNGSYFRKLNIDVPTFCLIQDTMNDSMQTEVINSSTCVVFASSETYNLYKDRINEIASVIRKYLPHKFELEVRNKDYSIEYSTKHYSDYNDNFDVY